MKRFRDVMKTFLGVKNAGEAHLSYIKKSEQSSELCAKSHNDDATISLSQVVGNVLSR